MPLQNYDIVNKIGKGKYCSVYLAQRLSDLQEFAMKKVNLALLDDRAKRNVLAQAHLLKRIHHQNIVQMVETFIDENHRTLCIVLELAEEGDLGSLIQECINAKTKLKEEVIWSTIEQISSGLVYLHSNNILHRDIKPTNILRFPNQKFKISDFNVSKITENLAYTRTGTLSYASPQIWNGLPYDAKSDIWSFGCMLYELMCLRKPFCSDNMEGLYRKVSKCQYVKIGQGYSRQLRDLVSFMIQTNPKLRPSSNTIYKMCQSRKNTSKSQSYSRHRGNALTPSLKYSLKDTQFQLNHSQLASNCEETVSINRQRLYSQISRKYYQPTLRSSQECEDKLQNLEINKNLGFKKTERLPRGAEEVDDSPQSRRHPRILMHRLNRSSLKRPRRNTEI